MAGSFNYNPGLQDLGRPADVVFAAVYEGGGGGEPWVILPNIAPVSVQWHDGARPPTARFRYIFDFASPYPNAIEDVFPLDSIGPYILENDDRIAIFRLTESGLYILFDGYCLSPQADITTDSETVTITAIGLPHREFDEPLSGAVMRNADQPELENNDLLTGLPARFNPEGNPNCSPEGHNSNFDDPRPDHGGEMINYPVFLGPQAPEDEVNGATLRLWTLKRAVQYIMVNGNDTMKYTEWDINQLDMLVAYVPKEDGAPINIDDPSTFVINECDIEDVDVTGMCWPDAVEKLIKPHGFSFRWKLDLTESGDSLWTIEFYRIDDTSPLKQLNLQKYGQQFNPYATNTQEIHLSRDGHAICNVIDVDMQPTLVEASFILAPGFEIDVGDATTPEKFVLGDPTCTGIYLDRYRLFVLDELGEGHWDHPSDGWVSGSDEIPDLDKIFNTTAVCGLDDVPPEGVYVYRRRKPLSTLATINPDSELPYHAKLHVSFDYGRSAPGTWDDNKGTIPGHWDGTHGTWDEVLAHDWRLLDDRIGIRVTSQDASAFTIGEREGWATYDAPFDKVGWPAIDNGTLPLVEMLTHNDNEDNWNVPVFMLTCLVEADMPPEVEARGVSTSPTTFEIHRRYDTRHRFQRKVVSQFSYMQDKLVTDKDDIVIDDAQDALAMANATLRAHQIGSFAGSVTIPRLTVAYQLGDKIEGITGRDMSLQSNAGIQDGASEIYPTVVGIEFTFEDRQATTLQLSDRRGEYQPAHRRQSKPKFSRM